MCLKSRRELSSVSQVRRSSARNEAKIFDEIFFVDAILASASFSLLSIRDEEVSLRERFDSNSVTRCSTSHRCRMIHRSRSTSSCRLFYDTIRV
jgi:hypothetical protein